MPAFSASDLPPFSLSSTHRLRWRRETYAARTGSVAIRVRSASRTGHEVERLAQPLERPVGRAVVDHDHLVARVAQVEQRASTEATIPASSLNAGRSTETAG